MTAVQLTREITSLLDALPAQSQSAAYQEWVGSDNDVYDEVFADAYPAW